VTIADVLSSEGSPDAISHRLVDLAAASDDASPHW
jgi:hypothetical protein